MSVDGYLVFPKVFSEDICRNLRERAQTLVQSAPGGEARARFTTDETRRQDSRLFLESARKIQLFYEDRVSSSESSVDLVNKLGHALHDLDPVFGTFSRNTFFARLAEGLGYKNPLLIQSMYIFKGPRGGGPVDWHQDATFLWTQPQSVMGFWVALEDATNRNGCLQVVPGGHQQSLKRRFIRSHGDTTTFCELDSTSLVTDGAIPLEVPMGTVVVLHGLLPHGSSANRSAVSRQAYTLHIIEGEAEYARENWLRPVDSDPWRGFT